MYRKLMYLICFVVVLSIANNASADLVGYWKFNESSGTNAKDSSGYGNNGTLIGDPQWVAGNLGSGALEFNGDDYVEISNPMSFNFETDFTWTAWIKTTNDGTIIALAPASGNWAQGGKTMFVRGGTLGVDIGWVGAHASSLAIDDGQWHHVASTTVFETSGDSDTTTLYVDGQLDAVNSNWNVNMHPESGMSDKAVKIGFTNGDFPADPWFDGQIDDVRIYNHALSLDEIVESMIEFNQGLAATPVPDDGAADVPRDGVVLSWEPSEFAAQHDIYIGDNFDDVNDATTASNVYKNRQDTTTFALGRLDFSQTYYWRIDEVNAPPDYTIFKGDVWSFTTEPFAYAIENITATASSSSPDQGPENTVNGLGLENDRHSTELIEMWISDPVGPQPTWIQYEFDKAYKLHEMWVWNHNGILEQMVGVGFKDVTIEYSVNGTDYTILGTTHEFAQGTAAAGYEHNTTVDFGGAAAKFVRLTANSNWVGFLVQYGLSEVRFLYIPAHAREPSPDSGATDVDVDVTLGFRAGREAGEHDVYLSTDEQAVIDGTAPVTTVTENSYSTPLDLGSTYYWRVDEVNDAETPSTWQGDIWNLSTQEFLVVDDFELYNDLDPGDPESNRIFNTWIDGYGITTNGSIVGYDVPPFAEQSIVYSGNQSMPFSYDNSTAGNSEATANVANLQIGKDWTKGAPETLVLWINGALSNASAAQLYVKINDTKVVYDGDLSVPIWTQWNVDLASLGISLSNITTLSIGVDGGGSGMLYVDDIALYRIAPPVVEPTPGGDRSLVAHWKLDETSGLTAADSSGYGNDGTLIGMTGTEWTAGIRDGALELAGGTAATPKYVDFGNAKSLQLFDSATISAWVKMNDGNADAYMGIGGKLISGYYKGFSLVRHSSNVFRLWCDDGAGVLANASSDATYTDTEWHHVVGVIDNGTSILYVDGVRQAQEGSVDLTDSVGIAYIGKQYGDDSSHRYWNGLIDDVRIYYRALSEQEISGL